MRAREGKPSGLKLFVAASALVYSHLTLVVGLVAICALGNDFFPDLLPFAVLRWLIATRDWALVPLATALDPLGSLPLGTLFQIGLPVVINALVFIRALKTQRRRWLLGRGWRLLNGYLLVLSFVCLGASLVLVGLFLLMALAFGLTEGLGALSH